MNSSPDKDIGFSTDNAKIVDKSPSDKGNVAISSPAIQELEISDRGYEDLSLEFQRLYPYAVRAFELIPLMYNRLTLVDKLSHKDAFTKICDDHKHLSGFSQRDIRRYLPSNNPITHKRVRPSCPKNSSSKINEPVELSIAQRESSSSVKIDDEVSWTNNYGGGEKTAAAANPQLQEESNKKGVNRNQIQCDVNRDVEIDDKMQLTLPDIQLKYADRAGFVPSRLTNQLSGTDAKRTFSYSKKSKYVAFTNSSMPVWVVNIYHHY